MGNAMQLFYCFSNNQATKIQHSNKLQVDKQGLNIYNFDQNIPEVTKINKISENFITCNQEVQHGNETENLS